MSTVPMADTIGADSVNIPTSFQKVAGYDTGAGSVPWTVDKWNRFPHSGHIHIDQSPGLLEYAAGKSAIADVEPGAGTILNFIAATHQRNARGEYGHLYCSIGSLPVYVGEMISGGLDVSKTDFWVADWNLDQAEASQLVGSYTLDVPGHGAVTISVAAVQWASPTSNPHTTLPGTTMSLLQSNVDLSETRPDWFAYVPPTPPPVVTTETGVVVTTGLKTVKVMSHDSGKTWSQTA